MDKNLTRRKFLNHTAKAAAGMAILPWLPVHAINKRIGPNDTINLGIVGLRNHGMWSHLWNTYYKMDGVRIVALCDPDRAILDREAKKFYDLGEKVSCYTDIRLMLENKDIDAISGATPNHWHALSTVWACQAGKHVCVEKPVSHNIWEGRKMVEAAQKYNRIVQADFDQRSNMDLAEAIDYLHRGELGKILLAHSWVYKRRESMGKVNGSGFIPKSVDYDLWCGPAPMGALPRVNLHYDWHWQWEYGNGEIGNNGPHHLDTCRRALGQPGLAPKVITFGGRYGYDDDGETPNTSITIYDYKPAPIIFEVRGLPARTGLGVMDPFRARSKKGMDLFHISGGASWNNAAIIVCEHGYLDLGNLIAYDGKGKQIKKFEGNFSNTSAENFIKALRSRNENDIKTTMEEGHLSTALCHMGNISYRVGKDVSFEEIQDVIKKDDEVLDAFERTKEHLRANGIDLSKEGIRLGPWLNMESSNERFTGQYAELANQYVKREYREPFVVRDQV